MAANQVLSAKSIIHKNIPIIQTWRTVSTSRSRTCRTTTFSLKFTEDTSLGATLLIPLDSQHRNMGAFRLVIYGKEVGSVPFPLEEVFPSIPDQLKGLFLNLPCSSERPSQQLHSVPVGGRHTHDQECQTVEQSLM
jgi:hypothetical protein